MMHGNWTIKTSFDHPPIPDRSQDYSAWCEGREEWKIGRGATEREAIADLIAQIDPDCD